MTQRLRPLHYGAIFFAVACAGLCLAALLTTEWYNVSYTGIEMSTGVYRSCTNGKCAVNTYEDFTSTTGCTRKGDELQKRTYAVFGLTIGGGGMSLLFVLATAMSPTRRACGIVSVLFALLALASQVAACILFALTYHNWYYCDKPFCSFAFTNLGLSGSCTSFFGYSYAFVVVAAACLVVGFVIALIAACKYLPPASPAEPPKRSDDRTNEAARDDAAPEDPSQPREDAAERPVLNNDGASDANRRTEMRVLTTNTNNQSLDGWELDPNTGLYWSDNEKLFYDPVSGHFYDPESELWYDPTTEQWYQGAEQ